MSRQPARYAWAGAPARRCKGWPPAFVAPLALGPLGLPWAHRGGLDSGCSRWDRQIGRRRS